MLAMQSLSRQVEVETGRSELIQSGLLDAGCCIYTFYDDYECNGKPGEEYRGASNTTALGQVNVYSSVKISPKDCEITVFQGTDFGGRSSKYTARKDNDCKDLCPFLDNNASSAKTIDICSPAKPCLKRVTYQGNLATKAMLNASCGLGCAPALGLLIDDQCMLADGTLFGMQFGGTILDTWLKCYPCYIVDECPTPTPVPTPVPTPLPTPIPTPVPSPQPTPVPTPMPTPMPTPLPTPLPKPMEKPTPSPSAQDACPSGQVYGPVRSSSTGDLATVAELQQYSGKKNMCELPDLLPADMCMLKDGQVQGKNGRYQLDSKFWKDTYTCFIVHGCTAAPTTTTATTTTATGPACLYQGSAATGCPEDDSEITFFAQGNMQWPAFVPASASDKVSSMYIATKGCQITLFTETQFGGASVTYTAETDNTCINLSSDMNKKASSAKVSFEG